MEHREKEMSQGLIYKKMCQVMAEIGSVGKDSKNTQQGFKFRGIDAFINALYPALVKHEVFVTPRCVKEEHDLRTVVRSSGKEGTDKLVSIEMEYDFVTTDGSRVTVGPIPAEGLDSGDKATNKALSAALKYALIQTFCVPTEDMAEGDAESPEHGKALKAKTVVKAETKVAAPSSPQKEESTPNDAKPKEEPKVSSFRKKKEEVVSGKQADSSWE